MDEAKKKEGIEAIKEEMKNCGWHGGKGCDDCTNPSDCEFAESLVDNYGFKECDRCFIVFQDIDNTGVCPECGESDCII